MKHIIYYFLLVFAISATTVTAEGKKPDYTFVDENGHEYVDLDLPSHVLWATCNVGASSPWEYGLYFAWGETKGYDRNQYHSFDWKNYKWCNGSEDSMSKYCTDASFGIVDLKTVLDATDDAAIANWGGGWHMPTEQEMVELIKYCKWKWKRNYKGSGVEGLEGTSKRNGAKIFLPANCYKDGSHIDWACYCGHYWVNSLLPSREKNLAYNLFIKDVGTSSTISSALSLRYLGFGIRPVRDLSSFSNKN